MLCQENCRNKLCIFAELSAEEISEISPLFYPIEIQSKGKSLHAEIPVLPGIYYLCNGKCLIITGPIGGKRLVSEMLVPGDVLMNGNSEQPNYNMSIQALTGIRMLFIQCNDFHTLVAKFPSLALKFIRRINKQANKSRERLLETCYLGSKERIAHLLLDLDKNDLLNEIPFRQEALAEMLGISREMVNRHLSEFSNRKLIKTKNHFIKILNVATLQSLFQNAL